MFTNLTEEGVSQAQLMSGMNLAELLDEEQLTKIAKEIVQYFDEDFESASEWRETTNKWKKLATQLIEPKNEPWPNASNVKFPLLTVAAMQFHARAFSASVAGPQPIKARIFDKTGRNNDHDLLNGKSANISRYMSKQISDEIPAWMNTHDRLCIALPIMGTMIKKTYFDRSRRQIISDLVDINNFAMDYYAADFKGARKTERIYMAKNELIERMRSGEYLDTALDKFQFDQVNSINETDDLIQGRTPSHDVSDVTEILESHCWLDLDEDEYKEPYIVVVDKATERVLSIHARWDADESVVEEDGTVIRLGPVNYYTDFGFIPDPGSNVYYMGFGALLGPTNETVNTLINQLVDAGTLSNLQGGFLGRGMRTRGGTIRLRPGEWKQMPVTGDDIRKNIFPAPVKEPSNVLFQLLGLLIDGGEKIASISDIMVGESPGQNQPWSTTQAVLEQGLKVFTSIYTRLHRALSDEYEKIYRLNAIHLDGQRQIDPTTMEVYELSGQDFVDYDHIVQPTSDPNIVTDTQRVMKADMLKEKIAMGLPLNIAEANKRILEAEGHEDLEALLDMSQVPPNPEQELKSQEFQHKQQIEQAEVQIKAAQVEADVLKSKAMAMSHIAKAENIKADTATKMLGAELESFKAQEQALNDRIKVVSDFLKTAAASKKDSDKNLIEAKKVENDARATAAGRDTSKS